MVPPIVIEDPEAQRLLAALAAMNGETFEQVIVGALRERWLRSAKSNDLARLEHLRKVLADIDARPRRERGLTDDDLYDERGLPK